MDSEDVVLDLEKVASTEKAAFFPNFFKTGPGQYGEGDKFIGVTVPNQRVIAKKYTSISLNELSKLLASPIHEHRLTALLILVGKYEKANLQERKEIYEFYLANLKGVNNWDLVDSSAYKIAGAYLSDKPKDVLYRFAKSSNIWERRIAIISTLYFIRNKQFEDTIKISELLLTDKEDLMHKAVGWMLREMGKQSESTLLQFLDLYYKQMPRTALRYAIERLSFDKKKKYMTK